MVSYFAISYFIKRISTLKDYRRGVYSSVEDEIRAAFCNTDISAIRQNKDMILLDSTRIIIKLRIPDKKHHISRKDGYRLIYIVYKDIEEVAFLDVYPKNGPLQQLDIDDNQLVELLRIYIEEKETGKLQKYQI